MKANSTGPANTPTALMWLIVVVLGVPGISDLVLGLARDVPADIIHGAGRASVAGFFAYCLFLRYTGRGESLASPRIRMAGLLCCVLLVATFALKYFYFKPWS
jgi:hypothetical protein